jgi:hypothetical protein
MEEGLMEDPYQLLRRLKLGREEYCQRLLTMLVLDGPYPRWNTRSRPSDRGLSLLRALDRLSFVGSVLPDDVEFIDELDLPGRGDGERGGAPDYGVVAGERLWLIELKTEVASHRAAQVPTYFELARHHYPDLRVDLTYLTPPFEHGTPAPPSGMGFAHLTWEQVVPHIEETWGGVTGTAGTIAAALVEALSGIGEPWTEWRQTLLGDTVGLGLRLARDTASDGQQRALDVQPESLEWLQELRVELRDACASEDGLSTVAPWLWNVHTSGAKALTPAGKECGYEVRFSRSSSRNPLWRGPIDSVVASLSDSTRAQAPVELRTLDAGNVDGPGLYAWYVDEVAKRLRV